MFLLDIQRGTIRELFVGGLNCEQCFLSPETWQLASTTATTQQKDTFIAHWVLQGVCNEGSHSSAFLVLHDALRRADQVNQLTSAQAADGSLDSILYTTSTPSAGQLSVLYRVRLSVDKDLNNEGEGSLLQQVICTALDTIALNWPCRTMGMAYNYARKEITVISDHKEVAVYSHSAGRLQAIVGCGEPSPWSTGGSSSPDLTSVEESPSVSPVPTEPDKYEPDASALDNCTTPATPATPVPRLLDYHNSVVYVIHKPVGCLSSAKDYEDAPRGTVYEFAVAAGFPHVGLVGRLDGDTSGIMVFTNDGRLNDRILRPPAEVAEDRISVWGASVCNKTSGSSIADSTMLERTHPNSSQDFSFVALKEKEYLLTLLQGRNKYCMENGVFNTQQFEEAFGLPLVFNRCNTEYNVREAAIKVVRRYQDPQYNKHERTDQGWVIEVMVNINEGKHKQIRRLAKRAGYHVVGLKRTKICGGLLCVESVPQPGDCRWLTVAEKYALYKGFRLI